MTADHVKETQRREDDLRQVQERLAAFEYSAKKIKDADGEITAFGRLRRFEKRPITVLTKAEDKHRRLLVRRNAAEERLWAAQERLWAAKMRFVAAKEQLEKEQRAESAKRERAARREQDGCGGR